MTVFTDALTTAFDIMNDAQGTIATYNGNDVKGDFVREYQDMLDVEGYGPAFKCMGAAVPAVVAGSTIIINGITYKVKGPPRIHECGDILLKLTKD